MEKIQELTDKLYREGVEKGNAEGQRLVEQAREEVEKLLKQCTCFIFVANPRYVLFILSIHA